MRPGGAEVSWGSNLDNYSPGYCQHVYHAHNHFQVPLSSHAVSGRGWGLAMGRGPRLGVY